MNKNVIILAVILFVLNIGPNSFVFGQEYSWGRQISGGINDNGSGIAMDGDGNIFVAGAFAGTLVIGPNTLSSTGPQATFIIKYDNDGMVQWAKSSQGEGNNFGYNISTDTTGNCVLVGSFYDSITFGNYTLSSDGDRDIYLVKFNGNGDILWAKSIGGLGADGARAVSINSIGEIFICGYFEGTVDFDGVFLSDSGQKIFLAKYDSEGNIVWARKTNINGGYTPYIAADDFGHCSITSSIKSTSSSCCSDIYIANYNETGVISWSKTLSSEGSITYDYPKGIAVDSVGDVYLCGSLDGVLHVGSITLDCDNYDWDIFLVKFDSNGNVLWGRQACGYVLYEGAQTVSVATDIHDNVVITGYFQDDVSFEDTILTSQGREDLFVCKYNNSGNLLWAISNGDWNYDRGSSVAANDCGNVAIVGSFRSGITFGPDTLWCPSGFDLYVAKVTKTISGDFNRNCNVDLSDLSLFNQCWLAHIQLDTELDDDSDAMVNLKELARLSEYWLQTDCGNCGGVDVTYDGNVTIDDLIKFASDWLFVEHSECDFADMNNDDFVGLEDFNIFLEYWMEGK